MGTHPTLVGRERELSVLRDALDRASDERTPQLVTLVGVPGMGKSRLVYELSRIADADPDLITWRQGRCLAYGDGVAFWALAEVVKAQAGILEGDTEAERFFRRKAAWKFEEALSSFDGVAREERAVLTYLVGELWRRVGDERQAKEWFNHVASELTDASTQQWVQDAARQQRDCPREWFG